MISLPAENPDAGDQPKPSSSEGNRGEVVVFPGFDFRWISSALAYWRKTGKAYNDDPAPDPQQEESDPK